MKLVGLTGGIACGKSVASNYLKQKGFPVIDCDAIAFEVVKKVFTIVCHPIPDLTKKIISGKKVSLSTVPYPIRRGVGDFAGWLQHFKSTTF